MSSLVRAGTLAMLFFALHLLPGAPPDDGPRPLDAQARCARQASCGGGCTAYFAAGFCVRIISVNSGLSVDTPLGTVKFLPDFHVSCGICECWYIWEDSAGRHQFKRSTNLSCGGGIGGITTQPPAVE